MDTTASVGTIIARQFEQLHSRLGPDPTIFRNLLPEPSTTGDLESQAIVDYQRFHLWANSLGVFAQGHASLDYRLERAPDVQTLVLDLLKELQIVLQQLLDLVEERRPAYDKQATVSCDIIISNSPSSESSSDGSEWSDEEVPASEIPSKSELEVRLDTLQDILNQLFSLAFRIRDPRTRQTSQTTIRQLDSAVSDRLVSIEKGRLLDMIYHLRRDRRTGRTSDTLKSFNDETERLVQRLALANVSRRQLFSHWQRQHHSAQPAAQKPIDPPHADVGIGVPTIMRIEQSAKHSQQTSQQTPATRLDQANFVSAPAPASIVSHVTRTPTAHAISGDQDDDDGPQWPSPPANLPKNQDFQCPFCHYLCPKRYQDPVAWKSHLVRDLRPYVCTYDDCLETGMLFDSYKEWAVHEQGHEIEPDFTCSDHPCHLCNTVYHDTQSRIQHMQYHLECIALFALPRSTDLNDQESSEPSSGMARVSGAGSMGNKSRILSNASTDPRLASESSNREPRQLSEQHDQHSSPRSLEGKTPISDAAIDTEGHTYTGLEKDHVPSKTLDDNENYQRRALSESLLLAIYEAIAHLDQESMTLIDSHLDPIRLLLLQGADPSHGEGRRRPLFLACRSAYAPLAGLLLDQGADANMVDFDGLSVVQYAAHRQNWSVVELLLQHGADPNHGESRSSVLKLAASDAPESTLIELVRHGAHTRVDHDGNSAISILCERGRAAMMPLLFEQDKKLPNHAIEQALRMSISRPDLVSVRILLKCMKDHGMSDFDQVGSRCIYHACRTSNVDVLRELLAAGCEPLAPEPWSDSPLIVAVDHDKTEIVKLLCTIPDLDLDFRGRDSRCAIHHAAYKDDGICLRILLGCEDVDVNVKDNEGRTPLMIAILAGAQENSFHLLSHPRIRVDEVDSDGKTALIFAAMLDTDCSPIVQLLVSNGADVAAEDFHGMTALGYTIKHWWNIGIRDILTKEPCIDLLSERQLAAVIVQAISEHDIDLLTRLWHFRPDIKLMVDGHEHSILSCCVLLGRKEAVQTLLSEGIHPDQFCCNDHRWSALHWSVFGHQLEIGQLLIAHGAHLEGRSTDGQTTLHFAAALGAYGICLDLLRQGADVTAEDDRRETPLFKALLKSHFDIVKTLLGHGAHVNKRDESGRTPLIAAIQMADRLSDQAEIFVELLLDHAADVNQPDGDGGTPLDFAARMESVHLTRLLLDRGANAFQVNGSRRTVIEDAFSNRFDRTEVYPDILKLLCDSCRSSASWPEMMARIESRLSIRDEEKIVAALLVDSYVPSYQTRSQSTPLEKLRQAALESETAEEQASMEVLESEEQHRQRVQVEDLERVVADLNNEDTSKPDDKISTRSESNTLGEYSRRRKEKERS